MSPEFNIIYVKLILGWRSKNGLQKLCFFILVAGWPVKKLGELRDVLFYVPYGWKLFDFIQENSSLFLV